MSGYRRLEEPVECRAFVDGHWWPGAVAAWRHDTDGWKAWVRYSTGVGENRLAWVPSGQVEPTGQ